MIMHIRYAVLPAILSATVVLAGVVWADDGDKKDGSLRVKDLPRPIPGAMEKIKEIGNEVGKGITKAVGEGAEAVKKTLKSNKAKEK